MRGATATAATGTARVAVAGSVATASLIALLFLRPGRVLDRDLRPRCEPLHDLDLVHRGEAGLDLPDLELLLPGVLRVELRGRRGVRLARGEDAREEPALLGRLRRLGLLHVDDLGLILLEDALDGDGEHLRPLLAEDVDVRGHARAELRPLVLD